MNLTGLSRGELRHAASYSVNKDRQQAARDEIVRRELAGETTSRLGRRKMGNDGGADFEDG